MPNCRDVTDRTSDFIDGELDFVSRVKIRLHLLYCRQCRRFVRQMRATVGLLGGGIDSEPPPGAHDELVAAYKARNRRAPD